MVGEAEQQMKWQGYHVYKKGQKVTDAKGGAIVTADTTLAERMILRMLNESVACLREQVVEDADLLDAGMIFGTGFAPFRGGPMHYAKTRGVDTIRQTLEEFTTKFGPRFTPDAGWATLKLD